MSYCEFPEIYSESFPKGRKQHRCVECAAPIEPGEKHLYYAGKWDGDFSDGRQHELCRDICMFIRDKYQSGECFPFGGLKEAWAEFCWDPYPGKGHRIIDDNDRKVRHMYAQIRWRERKHRTFRRRTHDGTKFIYWKRKWGQPWQQTE